MTDLQFHFGPASVPPQVRYRSGPWRQVQQVYGITGDGSRKVVHLINPSGQSRTGYLHPAHSVQLGFTNITIPQFEGYELIVWEPRSCLSVAPHSAIQTGFRAFVLLVA